MESNRQKRTLPMADAKMRATDGQEKRIEGYFATFSGVYQMWPGYTETVDPHAFDDCLGDDVRCLIDHDTRMVLGRTAAGTLSIKVDEHGLWFSVLINEDDTDAMNLYARVKRGDVSGCSFGFDVLECKDENHSDGSLHTTLTKVRLYEGSICTFPAYEDTTAEARKNDIQNQRRHRVEAWKKSMKERLDKWH